MTRTRVKRGRRPTTKHRTIERLRADLGGRDAVEAFADLTVGSLVAPSLLLEPFGIAEAGHRPDRGDLLEVQSHGVDARGTLERYPTPDGAGLIPVLRIGDLAALLLRSDPFPTGGRLEVEGFLYAFPLAWDRFHGVRVQGARRRWRIAGIQRREVHETEAAGCTIVRTPVDRVPEPATLDDRTLVELDLQRS